MPTLRLRRLLGTSIFVVWPFWAAVGHAAAPPGQFKVSADGLTVLDNKTGLTWERQDDGKTYAWAAAKTRCASLSKSGTGWRLPAVKELATLLDLSISTYATQAYMDSSAFPGAGKTGYWTATPVAGDATLAWMVFFGEGSVKHGNVINPFRVRCVR